MDGLSRKIYLELAAPTKEDAASSQERILRALKADYGEVRMPCRILRMLYPLCEEAGWKVTVTLAWDGWSWEITDLEAGDASASHYGVCADLGSTTVVLQLVDCETGRVLASTSSYNRQTAYGADILTRIFYTKDHSEHLEELRKATVETFLDAFAELKEKSGIDPESYASMVVSGNMTMVHFLIGMDPFCIFSAPYAVRADHPDFIPASQLGFPFHGYVYCYPGRANYLGGDIVSGAVATGIARSEEICVFLDIGTNGELVVGNREFLLCGAGGRKREDRHVRQGRSCPAYPAGWGGVPGGCDRRRKGGRDLRVGDRGSDRGAFPARLGGYPGTLRAGSLQEDCGKGRGVRGGICAVPVFLPVRPG